MTCRVRVALRSGFVAADEKEPRWAGSSTVGTPRLPCSALKPVTFRLPNVNQLWDDTLMMTGESTSKHTHQPLIPVLPLAKIGAMWKRQDYIEEGVSQTLLVACRLTSSQVSVPHPYSVPHGLGLGAVVPRLGV